ncbi:Protein DETOXIFICATION 53, partial [Camellia lanceoleosa]
LLSVCLEWWWYEIVMLLCGLLSNPQASLGADQRGRAQKTTFIGLIIAVVWGFLAFAFTVAVKDLWGKLYTDDPCILALTSIALAILGFCELGNSPQTAACGILIGSARPKMCYINFGSFYLIGLPVAALLGFKFKMGFVGLWFGLAAAQASCLSVMVYTLVHTDWKHQATRAKELTHATEGQKNDLETNFLN